jgi:hypothetical protein
VPAVPEKQDGSQAAGGRPEAMRDQLTWAPLSRLKLRQVLEQRRPGLSHCPRPHLCSAAPGEEVTANPGGRPCSCDQGGG